MDATVSRRRALHWLGVTSLGVLAACAPPTSPAAPTSAPAPATTAPATVAPSPAPATAAPVAAAPTSSGGPAWDQLLAAARSEGTVAVVAQPGTATQDALATTFQNTYGIQVNYLGGQSRDTDARLQTERAAGQYLWDVWVNGSSDAINLFLPANAFQVVEPNLVLPEVTDPTQWRNGGIEYLDDGHHVVVMTPYQQGTLYVNPGVFPPTSLSSYKDLLDPSFKGRLVLDDPRQPGPGQGTFTFFYMHPDLGEDYIRALATQEPTVLSDWTQEVNAIGQGPSLVLVGGNDSTVEQSMRQGVPVAIVDPTGLKEGSELSSAGGNVALFDPPAHPNAAKVYLNWLLSETGQETFARAEGYVSARLDVPTDFVEPWRVPIPGSIKTYDQYAITVARPALLALLKEVFPS